MKRAVFPAIFLLVLLVATSGAGADSFLAEYSAENSAVSSSLQVEGLMYSIGIWNNTMFLAVFNSNGSPKEVLLYNPPQGYFYPRASLEINGSIFITGDYHNSSGTGPQPFLMKISGDGKVAWVKIYSWSTESNPITSNGAIMTHIIPAKEGPVLLGTTTDMKIVTLKVSSAGTPVKGVLYSSHVGFFGLSGINTNESFLLSGSTSKGWAFFMRVNENLTPTRAEAFSGPKASFYVDLIRRDKSILAIVQSGNVLFINNLSTLANSSHGKVFVLPTSKNTIFNVIGTGNDSIILSTFATSPPAVLVVTPDEAYYFDYENMTGGLPESAMLWNDSVYFFLQRDFKGRIYLFKGPAVGYRWPPVNFKEMRPTAPGEYLLVPEELEIETAHVNMTSKALSVTTEKAQWDVTLLREWYRLSVRSNPPGADVVIDGIYYGPTPTEAYLLPGTYNISISRWGYCPWNAEINVSRDSLYSVNLTLMNGTLVVHSSVNGSVLWLNGRKIGHINGTLSLSLRPGNYTITVTKRDYQSFTSEVNLKPGERLKLTVNLIPLNGTVELSSIPTGANVYVNGTYAGETPLNLSLKPGKYTIVLRLENYSTVKKEISIEPNRTVTLNPKLTLLNGTLIVNGPVNASVYINGKLEGKAPLKLNLPPGEYLVNVTLEGAWNATRVKVRPNSTATVTITLPGKPSHNWLPIITIVVFLAAGGGYALWKRKTTPVTSGLETMEEKKSVEIKVGKAFGMSHVGARSNNEDNLLVMKLPDAYLLAVADGLGGHNAGEIASQIAVDTLKEVFETEYRKGMSDEDVKTLLKKAHELAHKRINEDAVGERKGMGTTLVTAFVRNGKAIIANTGDSRAYLIRDGSIVARTKDHSLVQELLDKGEITPEEAKKHPMRNIITKALGIDFGVDLYEWELKKGDVLLLSSDGLHDYVEEGRIVEIVSKGRGAEEIARGLIEEALPVTKDNVTVVVWR